uniref:SF3 helicase domain-containing protein n=1 Tax=viral metagenome TaxID=1070528 RepID=A0A6C0JWL7_9ZZZZ
MSERQKSLSMHRKQVPTSDELNRIEKLLALTVPQDWDDITFPVWKEVVWTLLSLGMLTDDIHKWCSLGKTKYNQESTDTIISTWMRDKIIDTGPTSTFMKWIRSRLYIRGYTDQQVYHAFRKASNTTTGEVIEKYLLENNNFKGYVDIYYELYAQTNIVTVDTRQPFYIWDDVEKLWIHHKNRELVTSELYTNFSDFMESILLPYGQKNPEKIEIVNDVIKTINSKRNHPKLRGWLLKLCNDKDFINLIQNIDVTTFAIDAGKIINLKTGVIRDRVRTDYYMHYIPISPSDHGYPKITEFINSLLESQEQRHYLQKLCGSFMTGTNTDKSFYIWCGEGMNDEHPLIKLLKEVLGYHAVSKNITDDNIKFINARLNILTDVGLTTARTFYENITETRKTKLLILTTNRPIIDSTDKGLLDKIKLLIFPPIDNVQNQDLVKTTGSEMFSYMAAGAKMFYEEGLPEPCLLKTIKEEYYDDENSFLTFLSKKCSLAENGKILRSHFYESYETFCNQNNLTIKKLSWLTNKKYIKPHRFTKGWYVLGYVFKQEE